MTNPPAVTPVTALFIDSQCSCESSCTQRLKWIEGETQLYIDPAEPIEEQLSIYSGVGVPDDRLAEVHNAIVNLPNINENSIAS